MTRNLFRRKFVLPVLDLLRQGTSPEKIALSIALGITLGVTPVLGSTSLLCLLAAVAFRLNLPAIQLVNYLVYPLQFAFLVPFIRVGGWIFGAEPVKISATQVLQLVRDDLWTAIGTLWTATLHALVAWSLLGSLASLVMYLCLSAAIRKLAQPLRARPE